ncbi:MAG: LL-diaminopimelate aminotransferase [Deltaproteobacteria bacterium]|nr:LL-diaminopimelate aminotransferase [Deltaproteobacteria bacterium]
MAKLNSNYDLLAAGYLFPEIARRAKAFAEKNLKAKLLRMGIGDTTEAIPPSIAAGMHARIDALSKRETYTGYGDSCELGELSLREAIAADYARLKVTINCDEIFVSDGAKPDSGNIQSIFSTDAVVAVQDPAYPVYVDTNVIAGRAGIYDANKQLYTKFIYMPCNEQNGFFPAVPDIKTDLIYICSPNNPTGNVATRAQLQQFVNFARKNKAVIIFDTAYRDYICDPKLPRSIYEIEGARECAIEIYSFSKFAGFTGIRLGWCVIPKTLVIEDNDMGKANRLWTRRQSTFFNGASNIAQAGALAALSEQGRSECQQVVDYYMNNAKLIRETLTKLGLTCFGGDNAPYVWLKTPNGMKSWQFFDKLLNETHVIGTPGSGFGPSGEGFFRLSAFGHRENVEAAMASISQNLRL